MTSSRGGAFHSSGTTSSNEHPFACNVVRLGGGRAGSAVISVRLTCSTLSAVMLLTQSGNSASGLLDTRSASSVVS